MGGPRRGSVQGPARQVEKNRVILGGTINLLSRSLTSGAQTNGSLFLVILANFDFGENRSFCDVTQGAAERLIGASLTPRSLAYGTQG